MEPMYLQLLSKAAGFLKQYWYWIVIVVLCCALYIMQLQLDAAQGKLAAAEATAKVLEAKIDQQNAAVDAMANAAKDQAIKLDSAIKHAAELKPHTTTIVKEVYSDKASDVRRLLLNARND